MHATARRRTLRMTGFGGRAGSARAVSLLFLLRRWRERNARTVVAPRLKPADAPSNTALASLAGGDLEERFHAWRGRSGRRYICSVFPVDHRAADAGLPEFAEAIVIAVRAGHRRRAPRRRLSAMRIRRQCASRGRLLSRRP